MIQPKIHTLAHGATVITTSLHGFKFSDGTQCEGQDPIICKALTLQRHSKPVKQIKGMLVNDTRMILTPEQFEFLSMLCGMADLIILPFPVLVALRESGRRPEFPNAVAVNFTPETQRVASVEEKIVDIQNWSW